MVERAARVRLRGPRTGAFVLATASLVVITSGTAFVAITAVLHGMSEHAGLQPLPSPESPPGQAPVVALPFVTGTPGSASQLPSPLSGGPAALPDLSDVLTGNGSAGMSVAPRVRPSDRGKRGNGGNPKVDNGGGTAGGGGGNGNGNPGNGNPGNGNPGNGNPGNGNPGGPKPDEPKPEKTKSDKKKKDEKDQKDKDHKDKDHKDKDHKDKDQKDKDQKDKDQKDKDQKDKDQKDKDQKDKIESDEPKKGDRDPDRGGGNHGRVA